MVHVGRDVRHEHLGGVSRSGSPALVVLHSVPPLVVFVAAEAVTDLRDQLAEAVTEQGGVDPVGGKPVRRLDSSTHMDDARPHVIEPEGRRLWAASPDSYGCNYSPACGRSQWAASLTVYTEPGTAHITASCQPGIST